MLAFFVGRYVFVMVGGNVSTHPIRAGRPAPPLHCGGDVVCMRDYFTADMDSTVYFLLIHRLI